MVLAAWIGSRGDAYFIHAKLPGATLVFQGVTLYNNQGRPLISVSKFFLFRYTVRIIGVEK